MASLSIETLNLDFADSLRRDLYNILNVCSEAAAREVIEDLLPDIRMYTGFLASGFLNFGIAADVPIFPAKSTNAQLEYDTSTNEVYNTLGLIVRNPYNGTRVSTPADRVFFNANNYKDQEQFTLFEYIWDIGYIDIGVNNFSEARIEAAMLRGFNDKFNSVISNPISLNYKDDLVRL